MTILSVVIPAYNEEGGIAEIANRVLQVKTELTKVGSGMRSCSCGACWFIGRNTSRGSGSIGGR